MELAIDFGGTNIKLAIFKEKSCAFQWTGSIPAHSEEGIEQALFRTQQYLTAQGYDSFTAVGIATPGVVNVDTCRLLTVNKKYTDAVNFDFTGWVSKNYHCPIIMENDANAALLGEVSYGCAEGMSNAVMMIFGTGIGTAAMVDRHLLRGPHYRAANLGGHSIIQMNGQRCNCGQRGCLEAYAGTEAFLQRIARDPERNSSILGSEQNITMKQVFEAAEAEDPYACQQIQILSQYYATGILNMVYAYDPECVILSGGIMKGSSMLLDRLEKLVNSQNWIGNNPVKIVVADHPDYSVTLGLKNRIEELKKG